MKRSEILGLDVLAAIALVGWFMFGPWINLYGFSFYHGRGDVWLPTPPPAINFFHGIVLTGSLLLAVVFLIISLILFTLGWWTGSDDNARAGRFAYRAFYGRASRLAIKYSALFLAALFSPYLYNFMWRYHVTREGRIYGGCAMALGILAAAMVVGNALLARGAGRRESVPA